MKLYIHIGALLLAACMMLIPSYADAQHKPITRPGSVKVTPNKSQTNRQGRTNLRKKPTPAQHSSSGDQSRAAKIYEQGDNYYYGQNGYPQDYYQASLKYREAANMGYPVAQNDLGHLYYVGLGVEENDNEAFKWFRKAALNGNAMGEGNLARCYYHGHGCQQDYAEALKWARKAADQGNSVGQYILGNCYDFGNGVSTDYDKAVYWYTKSAEQDNAQGIYYLALCYEYGTGVEKDIETAYQMFELSAELGMSAAQERADNLRSQIPTHDYGVDAAVNGLLGNPNNNNSSYSNNNSNSSALEMGQNYYYGKGVDKNYKTAVEYLLPLANMGNADAMKFVGLCYSYGDNYLPQDGKKAVEWFKKAFSKSHEVLCAVFLGIHYEYGDGVPQSWSDAFYWYKEAANLGSASSMYKIGECYEKGRGVTKNISEARRWYQKGAAEGNEDCKEALKRL